MPKNRLAYWTYWTIQTTHDKKQVKVQEWIWMHVHLSVLYSELCSSRLLFHSNFSAASRPFCNSSRRSKHWRWARRASADCCSASLRSDTIDCNRNIHLFRAAETEQWFHIVICIGLVTLVKLHALLKRKQVDTSSIVYTLMHILTHNYCLFSELNILGEKKQI